MFLYLEPTTRFELVTSSLPRKRSTPELRRLIGFQARLPSGRFKVYCFRSNQPVNVNSALSGRPGSNRRHSAWKADALPTELLPQFFQKFQISKSKFQKNLGSGNWNLLFSKKCGESRIRTCEDIVSRFTVCPRWPLEYLPQLNILMTFRADGGTRTHDLLITNQLL